MCANEDAKLHCNKWDEQIEDKHNACRCWRATTKGYSKSSVPGLYNLVSREPSIIELQKLQKHCYLGKKKSFFSVPPCPPGNLSRLWSVPPYNLATVDVRAFSSKQAAVWDSLCVFLSLGDPSSHFKSEMKTSPFLLLSLYIKMSLFCCSDLTLHCNIPKQNLH